MNIEKYNKRLLAIIGTLVLVGLAIGLVSILVVVIDQMLPDRPEVNSSNSLSVAPAAPSNNNSGKNQFILSYDEPKLIDSASALFVITCGQIKDFQAEELKNEYSSYSKLSSRGGFYGSRGSYNNIVLYDRLNNKKTAVFDKKISIAEFHTYNIQGKLYLFIKAAESDSNKDKMLNVNDLHSLYIYDIANNKTVVHKFDKAGVNDFSRLDYSDEFVVELINDANNDGEINSATEPAFFKHFNSRLEISDLLPAEMSKNLQKLIN